MRYNEAVKALGEGKTVSRKTWINVFLWLEHERTLVAEMCNDPKLKECATKNGGSIKIMSHICMIVYNGENGGGFIIPGWFANQSDSLADDWYVVGPINAQL